MPTKYSIPILTGAIAFFGFWSGVPSNAQIVPDRTLGSESSVVTPNVNIRGINSDRIDGGAVRGGNLFHSFQEFNVDVGRGAYFSNPDSIINILTRVTGGNISEIMGTLGVLGNANFFLINPNGIVFGPNARLDVGGSFFATTADGILFENGVEFAASNPEAPPLLTINMPLGLNIRENPGTIVNQTLPQLVDINGDIPPATPSGLYVPPEETIALIGGEVRFESGVIFSPGSNLELGGLSKPGIVELNSDGSLSFPANTQRADVLLTNGALALVVGNPGGNIGINARNLEILGGSQLGSGVAEVSNFSGLVQRENLDTEASKAGDVRINTTESIILNQNSLIGNFVLPNALGNSGNIDIKTNILSLSNQAFLITGTFGNGNAGNLNINATNVQIFDTGSGVFASVEAGATGNGGNLALNTQRLFLQNGSQISTSIFGNGEGGDLTVRATEIELIGTSFDGLFPSTISIQVNPGSVGNAGDLTIDTQLLFLRNGAQISAGTFGNGDGGNITINANNLELRGKSAGNNQVLSGIFTQVNPGAIGQGGTLTLNAQRLLLRDRAVISAATFSDENISPGGVLEINAQNLLLEGESQISASTAGSGDGGILEINTQDLLLQGGSQISASTAGSGDGGILTVRANNIELIGTDPSIEIPSSIRASVEEGATGNSGTLAINTQNLLVRDGGQIGTATFGNGNGGNLTIQANNIELVGSTSNLQALSGISASVEPEATGDGGSITLNTQSLLVRDGAFISTATFGNGNAGNLALSAIGIELIGRRSGLASSVQSEAIGRGGSLDVETERLLVLDGAQITSGTFGQGNAGSLTIDAREIEIAGTTVTPEGQENPSILTTLAASGSIGQAGTLTINANQLTIRDKAGIDVRSFNSEPAGNLIINAPVVSLDQGSLSGETSGGQGNILLNTSDLRLRNNSRITTNATGEATGGNIEINTDNLIAIEDSDISANAEAAFGGQVIIDANAIFGTQFRQQQTGASDITATSELGPEFSGTVDLDSEVDPAQGLVELPQTIVDPAALIAQNFCEQGKDSQFIATGRGGLPPSPRDLQTVDLSRVGLIETIPNNIAQNSEIDSQQYTISQQQLFENSQTSNNQEQVNSETIIPARGWIKTKDGIILVSYDPTQIGVRRLPYNFDPCQPQFP